MANVKAGRPSKISEDKINTALKLAEENKTIAYICKIIGITKKTYYNWCETYPKLKRLIDKEKREAEKKEIETVRKSLVQRATGYKTKEKKEIYDGKGKKTGYSITTKEVPADVKAQQFYLTNRDPQNWKVTPDEKNGSSEGADNKLHIVID